MQNKSYDVTARDQADERSAVRTVPGRDTARQPIPTPAVIHEVLSELAFYGTDCDLTFAAERILDSHGVSLAAGIAARRAYQRVGELWPIIDHLERFFAFVDANAVTTRAREIIAALRSGSLDMSEDDCTREHIQDELETLQQGQTPLTRCVARVAHAACWHGFPCDNELAITRDVLEIADALAKGIGEGAAREFADSFTTLGA